MKIGKLFLIDLNLNEIIRLLNQLPMAPVCPIGWREVACQPEPPLGCVGLSSAWPDRIDPTAAQRFDFDLISILFFFFSNRLSFHQQLDAASPRNFVV